MEKNSKLRKKPFLFLVFLIGIISAGAAVFGFYEASFFNTYLEHILDLDYIYISIMVSVSATFGLVFILVFGILSDNTRSKYGRRRSFFTFWNNYWVSYVFICVLTKFFMVFYFRFNHYWNRF